MREKALAKQEFQETGLSREGIANVQRQVALAKDLVTGILVEAKNISAGDKGDYGIIPGTTDKNLLKPGATKVVRAYNCSFGTPLILASTLEPNQVYFSVAIPIISLNTGIQVASGLGAASTTERKWTNQMKKRDISDHRDMTNTILKIASKRAMVDAALQLPGVSDFFTQDMDDVIETPSRQTPQKPAPRVVDAPPKDTVKARLNVLTRSLGWDSNHAIAWTREQFDCLPGDMTGDQRKEAVQKLEAILEDTEAPEPPEPEKEG